MSLLSPAKIVAQVARAVPADCREHIIIIGSLAAGYHFFGHDAPRAIRTKDIDCVLEPREVALEKGTLVAEKLLAAGWTQKTTGQHALPGKASDATDQLPAVRLYPPQRGAKAAEWFIELLTVPARDDDAGVSWMRLPLSAGHFGLPSFRFLRFAAFLPRDAGPLWLVRLLQGAAEALDGLLQPTGELFQLTPSVFIGATAQGQSAPATAGSFFKCPECAHSPLDDHSDFVS